MESQNLNLILTTPRGDEIGRLLVDKVTFAGAGTFAEGNRSSGRQMQEVYAAITEALKQEALTPALDPLDLQILVSRALMSPQGEGEPIVTIPVKPEEPAPDSVSTQSTTPEPPPTSGFDELLNLDDFEEGDSHE